MSGIDLMVQEHEHILKFVDIIRCLLYTSDAADD